RNATGPPEDLEVRPVWSSNDGLYSVPAEGHQVCFARLPRHAPPWGRLRSAPVEVLVRCCTTASRGSLKTVRYVSDVCRIYQSVCGRMTLSFFTPPGRVDLYFSDDNTI